MVNPRTLSSYKDGQPNNQKHVFRPEEKSADTKDNVVKIDRKNAKERIRTQTPSVNVISMLHSHNDDEYYDLASSNNALYDLSLLADENIQDIQGYGQALSQIISDLQKSPTALTFITEALPQNWKIGFDDLQGVEYSINAAMKTITIDHEGMNAETLLTSDYFMNASLIALAKSLRDIRHEIKQENFEGIFCPESVIMMERVRAADCDVLSILIAWELRQEGLMSIWRYMIGSELGDVAMAFSKHLERNPADSFTSEAMLAAFKAWYKDTERLNSCDHHSLDYMDTLMQESDGNPFGKKMPTYIAVELLSCLPDKTAYLQGFGKTIITETAYSTIFDVMNRTHLSHIIHDTQATIVQNVAFRNSNLAEKIFPYVNDYDLVSHETEIEEHF